MSAAPDLFQKNEDFRVEKRFQTHSEATVEGMKRGLASFKKETQMENGSRNKTALSNKTTNNSVKNAKWSNCFGISLSCNGRA